MMTEKSMYIGFYPDIFGDRMVEGRRNREPWNEILPIVTDALINSLNEHVKSKTRGPEFILQYNKFVALLRSHLGEIYVIYYDDGNKTVVTEYNAYLNHKLEMDIMK